MKPDRSKMTELTAMTLRLTLGLTLLLGPFNRSSEHEMLHQAVAGSWMPLALLGGAERAFLLADFLEVLLGTLLLAGLATRFTALATTALFTGFMATMGPTQLNRDMGLLGAALALTLLGSDRWSLDRVILRSPWVRLETRLVTGRLAGSQLSSRTLATLALRAGLAFSLLTNAILMIRGVAAFGSPIFEHPAPAYGLGLIELTLGLGLVLGWQTRWLGGLTAVYFATSLVWGGYGIQYRSLVLAVSGASLTLLGWDELGGHYVVDRRHHQDSPPGAAPSPVTLGLLVLVLGALLGGLLLSPLAVEGHQIYFETHRQDNAAVTGSGQEGDSVAARWEVEVYNLTYLIFALTVEDSTGEADDVKVTLNGPQGQQETASTSEDLQFIIILGHMPRVERVSEAMGDDFVHHNGTGVWELEVECQEARGTTVLGQDLGDDGQCDWSWNYTLEFYESHVVEHHH